MDASGSNYTIESLSRGLVVLKQFSPAQPEMGLAEIAAAASVSKATALRIAHTLAEAGFLTRTYESSRYRLGPAAISVGLATVATMTLPVVADPVLEKLRADSGETVQLAVPDGADVVIVGRAPSRKYPPNTIYIGHRLPIWAGSLGQAMLSTLPVDERRRVVASFGITPQTSKGATTAEEVLSLLELAAQRGWALNDQQTTLEHRSIAAPIVTPSGRAVAAINITVSAQRISARDLAHRYARSVVEAAASISSLLPETFAGRQFVA